MSQQASSSSTTSGGGGRERETEAERAHRFNKKKYTSRVFTNVNKYVMEDKFKVIRCRKCALNVLITDADIDKLPRRRTDNARVLSIDKNIIRLSTIRIDECIKIKRINGIERQYNHICKECRTPVIYQSVPHSMPNRLLYLIENNLLFPINKFIPKKRCRVCGYIPRDDQHFNEHIRDRGHYDQTNGSFPPYEDKNDTPVNPIIVG